MFIFHYNMCLIAIVLNSSRMPDVGVALYPIMAYESISIYEYYCWLQINLYIEAKLYQWFYD